MTGMIKTTWIPVLLLFLGLGACGGGGPGPVLGGGIGGTGKPGVKLGEVQTNAAVTVSGTTFDTTGATIRIAGSSAAVTDVRQGHVALVEGVIDGAAGTATRVTIDEVVKGALQSKPSPSTLTVQGQVVEVDERTIYGPGISPASPDGLLLGDLLEVWGFPKPGGRVVATRIEREDSLSERRVAGEATAVDTGPRTFAIGGQSIDYAAADVSRLAGGHPAAGQIVRVRAQAQLGPGGVLVATRVEPFDLDDADDNDDTEIEGFVTAVVSATRFEVGDVPVETNAETVYEGGLAADVVVGAAVEVEGAYQSGVLLARTVQFRAAVKLEGDIEMVGGGQLTLVGLPGIVVKVNDLTGYEGNAGAFGDLQASEHVRIRGRYAGGGDVVAVEIEERSADTDIEIQGPVDAVPAPSNPTFSIMGVSIDTSGIADGNFESPEGTVIGRAAFFASLAPGDLIKVSGRLAGGVPVWDEAEQEGTTLSKPSLDDD